MQNFDIKKIKCVIFDFDGTIVDSKINSETLSAWRNQLNLDCEYFQIIETIEKFPFAQRQGMIREVERLECQAIKNAEFLDGFLDLYNVLNKLQITMAIFTRNTRRSVEDFLYDKNVMFDLVIGRSDAKAKPDPEGIFTILDKMKVLRNEALLIGDDPILDISAGINAGVGTALIGDNIGNQKELVPNFRWDSLREGKTILENALR